LGYIPPDPFVRGEGSRACRMQRKRGALPAGPTERGGPHRRMPAMRRDVMALSNSPRGLCGLLWTVAQIPHRIVAPVPNVLVFTIPSSGAANTQPEGT
jgi:hypothetical protein